jgi:16S rRNA (guanine966-N2)-methyltransferase
VRIVGGKHRGRALATPEGGALRPTSDRVRESIFNVLTQGGRKLGGRDVVRDARVLDGYAGTGALGIEALSRGASAVTLMDNAEKSLMLCRANVAAIGEQSNIQVLAGDCLIPVRAAAGCGLIFLDPPYRSDAATPALLALTEAGWITAGAICVVELATAEKFDAPESFEVLDERTYGSTRVVFLQH